MMKLLLESFNKNSIMIYKEDNAFQRTSVLSALNYFINLKREQTSF